MSYFIHTVDHSRVTLQDMDPNVIGSDYINANYVGVSWHTKTMLKKKKSKWTGVLKATKWQVRSSDFLHTICSFSMAIELQVCMLEVVCISHKILEIFPNQVSLHTTVQLLLNDHLWGNG